MNQRSLEDALLEFEETEGSSVAVSCGGGVSGVLDERESGGVEGVSRSGFVIRNTK